MSGAMTVREEVWFDSADGVSRIHGYLWWPEGIVETLDAGPAEHDGETAAAAAADALGAHSGVAPVVEGISTPNDVGDAEGSGPQHGAGGVSDTGGSGSPAPSFANALEAAARSVAISSDEDSSDAPDNEGRQPDADGDAYDSGGQGAEASASGNDGPGARASSAFADKTPRGSDEDAVEVKGIVQLVHGMAEHIGRYDEFARFLAQNGYIVCGHDHIGHGLSASHERLGRLPARRGKDYLIADVGRLRSIVQDRIGDELPYFLFGHSLGSFVVRAYIAREGDGLAGAIICGTGHVSPGTSALGHFASRLIGVLHGQYAPSRLLHAMGVGAYAKSVRHRRTVNDWLSYNTANVDAYNADELCGFPFSAGGYATLTALTREVCSPAWAARVPRLLPLLFIGGNADPVGDGGEGVRRSSELVRDAGCADVTCMIYKRMRHEILNEDDRQMVFDDVLFWLEVRS